MPRIAWSADMGPEWDVPRFKRRVRQLRRDFPINDRVIVRLKDRVDNPDIVHGHVWRSDRCFVIEVLKQADISNSINTLWHEWAHILAGVERGHCADWAAIYGRIYKFYQG